MFLFRIDGLTSLFPFSDSEIAYTSDNGVATSSENTEINYDIESKSNRLCICRLMHLWPVQGSYTK